MGGQCCLFPTALIKSRPNRWDVDHHSLGTKGFVGLALFYLAMILPVIRFVRRFPARLWANPRVAAGLSSPQRCWVCT